MDSTFHRVGLCLAMLALALQPMAAHASGVELFVQAPYDFYWHTFDLDGLESQNLNPIFSDNFSIPYDAIEAQANAVLQPLAAAGRQGHIHCEFAGIDAACPDSDWRVSAEANFHFTQRNPPVLTSFGSPTSNGVHVQLNSQVHVGINGHVYVTLPDSPIPDPERVDIPVDALINIAASADLTLYPVISLQNLAVDFTNQSLDLEIKGLDDQAIGLGAAVGVGFGAITGVGLGPIANGLLGGILAGEALDAAKDAAKHAIEALVLEQLAHAGGLVTKAVNDALQPEIGSLNDVLASLQSITLPGVNQNLQQLQSTFGISVDVRSITRDDNFRSAVTTRFAPVAGSTSVSGVIRFPRKACDTFDGGSSATGPVWGTLGLVEINGDLDGMNCADLISSEFSHVVYYGANPEAVLQSGDPQNNLLSWGEAGVLSSSGVVMVEDDAYVCPFSVANLPANAIIELGPAEGSTLESRLLIVDENLVGRTRGAEPRRGRFIVAAVAGTAQLFDHVGRPIAYQTVEMGRKDPNLEAECPSGHGDGGGEVPPLSPVPTPETCKVCGPTLDPGSWKSHVLPPMDLGALKGKQRLMQ